MHPYRDSTPTRIALAVFFIVIIIYAYFEARGILFGPTINVPQTIEQVSSPYIELTGTTSHIATLSANGQSIPVTEQGAFTIPYALSPGYNRIVLDATDKYGHATEKVIEVVYTPSATSSANSTETLQISSSTAATSTGSTSSRQAASSSRLTP